VLGQSPTLDARPGKERGGARFPAVSGGDWPRRKSRREDAERAKPGRRSSVAAAAFWIGPSYLVFLAIMAFPAAWNIVISFFSISYGRDTFVGFRTTAQS